MRRCQLRDIGSKVHASLSSTDGNVTRPTFLNYLRSLSLPSIEYKKIEKNLEELYIHVYSLLFTKFCYCWFRLRMYLWCCRSANNESSVQLQLLRPRLIGHWTVLCLSKGPLCRLTRYKLWSTERGKKVH